MILMIFIVIDDVMFYLRGQILTIITNSLKLVPVYNSSFKVYHLLRATTTVRIVMVIWIFI